MTQREPSAAQAIYGHLPSGSRPEVEQAKPSLAEAMYGRPQEPMDNPWLETMWEKAGIRRRP